MLSEISLAVGIKDRQVLRVDHDLERLTGLYERFLDLPVQAERQNQLLEGRMPGTGQEAPLR